MCCTGRASARPTQVYIVNNISRQAVLPLRKQMFQTRQQLGNKIYQSPHSAYAEAMKEVFLKEEKCSSVGFHSDVYYVRSALEKKTGFVIPLPLIEAAMQKEGWKNA